MGDKGKQKWRLARGVFIVLICLLLFNDKNRGNKERYVLLVGEIAPPHEMLLFDFVLIIILNILCTAEYLTQQILCNNTSIILIIEIFYLTLF